MKVTGHTKAINQTTFALEHSFTIVISGDQINDLRMLGDELREDMYGVFGKAFVDEVLRPLVQGKTK